MRSLFSMLGLSNAKLNRSTVAGPRRSGAVIEGLESRELFSVALTHVAVLSAATKLAPKATIVSVGSSALDNDGDFVCGNVPRVPIHFGGGGGGVIVAAH